MKKELSPQQALAVQCPTCGAKPEEKCELSSGQPRTDPHRDRRLIAKDRPWQRTNRTLPRFRNELGIVPNNDVWLSESVEIDSQGPRFESICQRRSFCSCFPPKVLDGTQDSAVPGL